MGNPLKKGDSGHAVQEAQKRLAARQLKVQATGVFDHHTVAAVKSLQDSFNITGQEESGEIGNLTFLATFGRMHADFSARLIPRLRKPEILDQKPTPRPSILKPPAHPAPMPSAPRPTGNGAFTMRPSPDPKDVHQFFNFGLQLGYQQGIHTGAFQAAMTLTLRLDDYQIRNIIAHPEIQFAFTMSDTVPTTSFFSGQYSVNITPVTDWWMYRRQADNGNIHLMNGFVNFSFQRPLSTKGLNLLDPATHDQGQIAAGVNLVQVDFLKQHFSLVVAAQTVCTLDFQTHGGSCDQQAVVSIQAGLKSFMDRRNMTLGNW